MPKTSSLTVEIKNASPAAPFPSPVAPPMSPAHTPTSPRIPSSPRTTMSSSLRSFGQSARIIPSATDSFETSTSKSLPIRGGPPNRSQRNLLDTSSVAGSSIAEDDTASDAGSQASWQPPRSLPYGTERERRPSRHAIFQNMLSRSRSTKQNLDTLRPPSKTRTTRERFLDSRSRERDRSRTDALSPNTAPLEPDRAFRDAMSISSGGRNQSAERANEGGREAGDATSGSNRRIAHFKQRATDVAGRTGKGIMDKLKSTYPKHDTAPVEDANYQFKLLHLPLVEQTRRTRLRGRMSDAKDKTEFWMPALPYRAIDYLNSKGIEAEGLYRVPGSVKDIKHWQMRFDKEGDVNLLDVPDLEDVYTVGSMLKAWLREMPDPLIPKDAQQRIAPQCVAAKDSGETPQILKDELSKLPPFHYYLLFAITAHIALLYKFREYNKMSYHNLCICFQPCLTIDAAIFQFLVEDWKNCWQGCWTEKIYLEEEYRIMDGRPPTLPAVPPLSPKPRSFQDGTDASTPSSITPRPSTAVSKSPNNDPDTPSLVPLPRTPTVPGASHDTSTPDTIASEKPVRPERPSTPPELAPMEPVSPMRM